MGRTNIDIDDGLVEKAMERYGLRTKREAVDLALRRLVGTVYTTEDVLAMEGTGWDGDLEEIRGGVVAIEEID
jgi:Arc/MetJ family transcription regulator